MFTLPSTCLLGISRELPATARFTTASQTGNSVCPLHNYTVEERESVKVSSLAVAPINSLIRRNLVFMQTTDFSKICISAIIVFHDPRNWVLDIQVMCDLIQSRGVMGGPYLGADARKAVDLVFCNPDLIWKSDFDRPRLGQGAFKEAFQGVFKVCGW